MQFKSWQKNDPITINKIQWNDHEFLNVKNVFENDWFGPGA